MKRWKVAMLQDLLVALLVLMLINYVTGIIAAWMIPDTKLDSHKSYKGLWKKFLILCVICAGVGYIITDQLERNANFSKLEAFATVAALAYIKEKYVDDHFDSGDITATLSGYMLYQVSF